MKKYLVTAEAKRFTQSKIEALIEKLHRDVYTFIICQIFYEVSIEMELKEVE